MSRGSTELTARYALRALRRRLPFFVLCVLLVPAAALIVSALQKKQYTATATLYFRNPGFDQMVFGSSLAQPQIDPTVEQDTNLGLVSLPRVAQLTAAKLQMTEQQVESEVSESKAGDANLATIQATANTPQLAADLATTYATEYIAFRRGADRAVIASAELPVEKQIASLPPAMRNGQLGQSLQTRLGELRVLASLQTGNAELVQRAEVPRGPSSPKPVRNAALGLFLGILLGAGLVILLEALDRRLRDPGEVEQIFERPVLGAVPENAALADLDADAQATPDSEAFRMLWANLRYLALNRHIRTVLVTSADRDDGKTTVAWGLAAAAANAAKRVLLVEADLRNPTFAGRFKLSAPMGLTSLLVGDSALREAVLRYRFPRGEDDPRPSQSMDVLFAGPRPPNPSDLLQSHRMAEVMREAAQQYDLIVVDTPPAAAISDAIPLFGLVDGVIVVSRLGRTFRDHAHRLRRQLVHVEAPLLGVVVNSIEETEPYAYGYEYGEPFAPPLRSTRQVNWVRAPGDRDPSAPRGRDLSANGDGDSSAAASTSSPDEVR
jgi:capsular exopolysaccharide synthesis family protein